MDRINECQKYIKKWYLGESQPGVRMAADDLLEQLIQLLVVELLRDLIDNPIPENMMEGSQAFNIWIATAYAKVADGINTGFGQDEIDQVKNLAWNYWVNGIRRTQQSPECVRRLYQCRREISQQ